ncbi:hypothetical protein FB45DRAFT_140540 [Roridomyces roridus]|uniref:Uncharacterized protein n=1 Tax=Roridomyces roridus TaxID=1738132 RepID=A0AAD7BHS5_9AGAR|nr:hypothetical protein FB45DRAFT_140540 [Roridomyces roridus]
MSWRATRRPSRDADWRQLRGRRRVRLSVITLGWNIVGLGKPQDTSLDDVQMPAPDDNPDEEGELDRSGADEPVDKAAEASDRETEPEVYPDPEMSAWNAERSQILEDSFGELDDDMDAMLMYPPEELVAQAPVVVNGDDGKARSRSGSRKLADADDADIVLPPTASTNNGSQDPIRIPASVQTVGVEVDPKHLDAAMALLNEKSNEIHLLTESLHEEQRAAEAARARNLVLEERLRVMEFEQSQALSQSQSQDSANADLANRLKLIEELLATEQTALATALQAKATAETERDATSQSQDSANANLANRLKLAEELLATEQTALAAALQAMATAENERDAARREKTAAEEQVELFRDLYGKASAFADEKTALNKELEKRVNIAETQTREGISTIRATFALREQALKSQAEQWRNQSNLLREQIVNSNQPEINRRAAEYPEVLQGYEQLREQLQYVDQQKAMLVHEKQLLFGEKQVVTAKYAKLVDDNERLTEQVDTANEDVLVKQEECYRLEQQVAALAEEIAALKSEKLVVDGEYQVLRCGWRAEATNTPCPALCRTREDLNLHAAMHVTGALSDIVLDGNVNSI